MKLSKTLNVLLAGLFLASCVPVGEKDSKLSFRAPSSIAEEQELKTYNSEIQMAPRRYIESVLLQVFNASGTTAANYIQSDIYQRVEFGGACDEYSASDIGAVANSFEFPRERCINTIKVVQKSTNNPMRYSLTTKVCERLVKDETRLEEVRKKVFPSMSGWGTVDNAPFDRAWDLFYPVKSVDNPTREAFRGIASVTENNKEAWRAIILTLCVSPEWQAL